jgi:hypothetical protein
LVSSALACSLFGTAGAALSADPARSADAPQLTLSAGAHYSQGDYGTDSTTRISSLVFTGRYETGSWTFRGTVPYLHITGRGTVIPGVGRIRDVGLVTETRKAGFGDPVLSATYAAYSNPKSRFAVDVTGRIKVAVGKPEDQLSTGEHDLGFQVDAFKTYDSLSLFAGIGYTVFGSTPVSPLEDGFYYTLGGSWRLNQRDSVGVSYDEREPVVARGPWQRELTLFGSRRFERGWRAQTYFLLGMAEGSPDWGIGVSFAKAF